MLPYLETEGVNTCSFWLPSLPGSVNEIYELNRPDSGLPRKRLKAEWALWASSMMVYIPRFTIKVNSVVRVDRCYYYPWFYRNQKWRKADVANMDKLLFDTIAKKIGVDDLFFKQGWTDSRDAQSGKVQVRLVEVTESQWRNAS